MKGKWKVSAAALSLTFALGTLLSGCGSSASPSASPSAAGGSSAPEASKSVNGVDTSKEVKLKMVLMGSKPADFDAVYGEVNKIMKQKINATLDVSFIDWADENTKYPLIFASNEDFDLVISAPWLFYTQQATKNGFLELTPEMLQKYAPTTYKEEPKEAWEQAKVKGKIFMVPQNNFEYSYHLVAIRGDLREKYSIPELKSEADYLNYLKTIAAKEKGIIPSLGPSENNFMELIQPNEWNAVVNVYPVDYKLSDSSGKLFNYAETPEFASYVNMMYDAAKNGAWARDAITSKLDKTQGFKEGKLASVEWNLGTLLRAKSEMKASHPDWKVELYDLSPNAKRLSQPFINNGMSIHATSKNPERALMAIELLRNDPQIHDLTNYGIQGKHYEAVGTDTFKPLADSAKFPPAGVSPWGWNSLHERLDSTVAEDTKKFTNLWKNNLTVHHPLETFAFDDSKVKNEEAAVNNIMDTYGKPLFYGLVDPNDAGHGLNTFKEKLKQAGIDKIIAEMQAQVDAQIKK